MKTSSKISNLRRDLVNIYSIDKEYQLEFLQIYREVENLEDKKPKKRTLTQNRYLHLLISLFAIEIGYTLDEAKTHLKRNCDFMIYDKNGEKFLTRSRDLDTKELTNWIEWIKNYAGMNGIQLPSADDYHRNWEELEKTIEQNKQFL